MNPLSTQADSAPGPDASAANQPGNRFRRFAHACSLALGSPWAFIAALAIIMAWAMSGPFFRYSDTWQLIINTATTLVTFLMVFVIQNTQNRDAKAIHLKLDELLRALRAARTDLVDLEDLSDEELDRLQKQFARIRERAHPQPNPQQKREQEREQHGQGTRGERPDRSRRRIAHRGKDGGSSGSG